MIATAEDLLSEYDLLPTDSEQSLTSDLSCAGDDLAAMIPEDEEHEAYSISINCAADN